MPTVDHVIAAAALVATVGLAVARPTVLGFRFSPGRAALVGVAMLLGAGLLAPSQMFDALRIQWRPLVTLTSIMTLTGVVQEVGAFDRLAAAIEHRARSRPVGQTFAIVFALSMITPALLNNDAAILILTPLVVALTRRLYARDGGVATAFAFAVFLGAGVAPFVVSNPMNMIVAEGAGIGFNEYAAVMVPLWLLGGIVTFTLLRWSFRAALRDATSTPPRAGEGVTTIHRHPGERPAVALMLAVFIAYPIAAWLRIEIWTVAAGGALASLALCRVYHIAPLRKAVAHVSLDILVFLWGIFLVALSLRSVGAVDQLRALYDHEGAVQIAVIGATSAAGSALIDNHPMALLNMMAIDTSSDPRPIFAALVGGDLGPRLLPIGSLAGLLWIDLLRRAGIEVPLRTFVRVGTIAALPALAVTLALLWLLG